jgi:glycosyltransferase involved in cell wall biosynthesis
MKISVVIPTYKMFGKGIEFLQRNLENLKGQTFKDFEILVTDNSEDNEIEKICGDIRYIRNQRAKNWTGNLNNGILNAKGEYIKILFLDDYFQNENSLMELSQNLGDWTITGCSNHPIACWSERIKWGINTVGSPSVLTIKNDNPLLFNESLVWVADCDYYIQLHKRYGLPVVLNKINVVIGTGEHQLSNHLSNELKHKEVEYLCQKYS